MLTDQLTYGRLWGKVFRSCPGRCHYICSLKNQRISQQLHYRILPWVEFITSTRELFLQYTTSYYIFFLQKEKKLLLLEQSGCDVPMPEPFCHSCFSPHTDKIHPLYYLFQPSQKAHKTGAIQSQGNNRFVQARSSSHSPEKRHSLADMVL